MKESVAAERFQLATARLDDVETTRQAITITYDLDGYRNVLQFEYGRNVLDSVLRRTDSDASALHTYAVSLAVICVARFGAVLPRRFDLTAHSAWVDPRILTFLKRALPRKWSEHRYQLDRLDYFHPELVVDEASLGSRARVPILQVDGSDARTILMATGSGKDSLLCETILDRAGVEYEAFTYLHELYGDLDGQQRIFDRVPRRTGDRRHVLAIRDDLQPWLERRMAHFGVSATTRRDGVAKAFRTEAGEVLTGSFAMIPIQVARGIGIQAFGNEKSADFPNLIDEETGEAVAHQFAKSIYGEAIFQGLYDDLFTNVGRVSLTKPIHDVKIFKTLFAIADDLPYLTNSCNIEKPWCGKCEKCLYVFAGFAAFGDHKRTVEAFGGDLFDVPDVLPIWEDLIGLRGRIAWECVGHPEEAQLFFYRALKDGVGGCALEMFQKRILDPLCAAGTMLDEHFSAIEERYSIVHTDHHHMPDWLSQAVFEVLGAPAGAAVVSA